MGNFYQAVSSNKAVSGFLLDLYTNSSVAYSLRKVRSGYTGDCIEVYNGTSYADIGFDSSNVLDLSALATHCGSNDGFVSKWYSQSSSANTAIQTDTANMPKIYDGTSAAVTTENGKPVISRTSTAHLIFTNVLFISNAHNFIVANQASISSSSLQCPLARSSFTTTGRNNAKYITQGNNAGGASVGSSLHIDGVANSATQKNTLFNALGTAQRLISSVQDYSSTDGQTMTIGTTSSLELMFDTQEIIIFDDDMSSNRADIENRINLFYNIY